MLQSSLQMATPQCRSSYVAVASKNGWQWHMQQAPHCIQQLRRHLITMMPACLPAQAGIKSSQNSFGSFRVICPMLCALSAGSRVAPSAAFAHRIKQVQDGDSAFYET